MVHAEVWRVRGIADRPLRRNCGHGTIGIDQRSWRSFTPWGQSTRRRAILPLSRDLRTAGIHGLGRGAGIPSSPASAPLSEPRIALGPPRWIAEWTVRGRSPRCFIQAAIAIKPMAIPSNGISSCQPSDLAIWPGLSPRWMPRDHAGSQLSEEVRRSIFSASWQTDVTSDGLMSCCIARRLTSANSTAARIVRRSPPAVAAMA